MKKTAILYCLSLALTVTAQPQVRSQQYFPEGRAFVCENGTNRYTRALYGSHTDWRLDTSDRPVFAVVKKNHHRNIRFEAEVEGRRFPLDSTTYCRAEYVSGLRLYTIKDERWPEGAALRIETVARPDTEGALWNFIDFQFPHPVKLRAIVSHIAQPRLYRNGDIGVEKSGVLEAQGQPLQVIEWTLDADHSIIGVELDTLRLSSDKEGGELFFAATEHFRKMASRIQFDTPDPYINTLGSALVLAADGAWDGQTWLHGAVGWRMPLAGWRAGYLGDVLGWADRAVSHFDAYAKSQVRDVPAQIPHPSQDAQLNMARAEKRWGTQMYSNGYICRNPERNDQMHHYDMNLNYIDELLWHFQYDASTDYLRKMWPTLKAHLDWEKRNYDPDGDHLFDAYCCIWASDALYYNGGAVTHSSAYNYRGFRLAARIAERIGEDPAPYRAEAEAILKAMNQRLWLSGKGVWAEYQDLMGLQRLHEHPALWSVYTPIDCGACSPEQAYEATRYVDANMPHIDVEQSGYQTIATSDWLPYAWSINNVAAAEVMHTALAYFEAGRNEAAFRLMKANILDQMYYGQSPANFGQISHYDAARGECYRDFADCTGISSRTLLQGLFGIVPQALDGTCIVRPGFPSHWDSAAVSTPYIKYKFTRRGGKVTYDITQHFAQRLKIVVRQNLGNGQFRDIEGSDEAHQVIVVDEPPTGVQEQATASCNTPLPADPSLSEPDLLKPFHPQKIEAQFNAEVDDIFKQQYLSPRPQVTTLQIPTQGIGEWCHPEQTATINDSVFRTLIENDRFTVAGVPFRTPKTGQNIIYTSRWDNYPTEVRIPLKGKAEQAYLLMAGSTNHMQSRIANGEVVATYTDGSSDTLTLTNPDNWCPIEQDYYVDGKAFRAASPRPYRVCLGTGTVSRSLGEALHIEGVYGREIPGGAAQMLRMPLNPRKRLRGLTLRSLSNDVVIGLMAVTLQ